MLQRLLRMGVDMVTLETKRKAIEDKLDTLTNLEKCEFEKRLRTILSLMLSRNRLTKDHNLMQEAFQENVKKREKTTFKFIGCVILIILIENFFDNLVRSNLLLYIGILAIAFAVFEIKKEISNSAYTALYRNFQFEIDRVTNEITQYGHFLTSESDLFFKYDGSSEEIKNEFTERTIRARFELKIEILSFMNLQVELENDN
jgi:hypothetical protein